MSSFCSFFDYVASVYSEIVVNGVTVRSTRTNVMYYFPGTQQSSSTCNYIGYLKVGDTVANAVRNTSGSVMGLNQESGLSLTLRIMRLSR